MNMEEEEIEEINITKTKNSKEKKIVYIETEAETVVELFRRGAKAKNRDYQLVNFIPPQIFQRYKKSQDICAELRREKEEYQYTVRIEQKDVAIKVREEKEKYWKDITKEYIDELEDQNVLPLILSCRL